MSHFYALKRATPTKVRGAPFLDAPCHCDSTRAFYKAGWKETE